MMFSHSASNIYHVIVTHGYELIARSHEEWAWPPHGSSSV